MNAFDFVSPSSIHESIDQLQLRSSGSIDSIGIQSVMVCYRRLLVAVCCGGRGGKTDAGYAFRGPLLQPLVHRAARVSYHA